MFSRSPPHTHNKVDVIADVLACSCRLCWLNFLKFLKGAYGFPPNIGAMLYTSGVFVVFVAG